MKSKFTPAQDREVAQQYLSGETAQQIAERNGVYKQSVLNSLKRSGVERRKDWQRARGKNNGNWGGGTRMVKGYKHIFLPSHPLSRSDGWIGIHRLKMAEQITDGAQVVHHVDGNILNNDDSNLQVFKNNSEHMAMHAKERKRDQRGMFQ